MNDTFNFRRFGLLFKKTLLEQSIQTFGLLALAFVATFLLYRPYNTNLIRFGDQEQTLHLVLFLGGGSLSFFMFNHYSENTKGYSHLLLPSSYFEKWLSGFTICLLFLGIYLAFFRLIDSTYVNAFFDELAHSKNAPRDTMVNFSKQLQILSYNTYSFQNSLALFFILTGATAVGSLYFNKNAFVKIFIAIMFLIWSYIFLNAMIAEYFFQNILIVRNFFGGVYLINDGIVVLPQVYQNILTILFNYCLPIALWFIALIRLREKEI